MSEQNAPAKKSRTARPILVEKWQSRGTSGASNSEEVFDWKQAKQVATVTEAEKWLKKEGEADVTYRIITVEREIKLVVESKRVASFA